MKCGKLYAHEKEGAPAIEYYELIDLIQTNLEHIKMPCSNFMTLYLTTLKEMVILGDLLTGEDMVLVDRAKFEK